MYNNDFKYNYKELHITTDDCICGWLKHLLPIKVDKLFFPLNINLYGMPKNLSETEVMRCLKLECKSIERDTIEHWLKYLISLDFKSYNKIIIWHRNDALSLLTLYFFCSIIDGEIYRSDISKIYWTYNMTTDDLGYIYLNCKLISKSDKKKFADTYKSLLNTEGIPKIACGWKIKSVGEEHFKQRLLKNMDYPRTIDNIITRTFMKHPKSYYMAYPMEFYLDLLLKMIVENRIIIEEKLDYSKMKMRPDDYGYKIRPHNKNHHKIKVYLSDECKYIYNGKDLKDFYLETVVSKNPKYQNV